jgi:hypothetical protein
MTQCFLSQLIVYKQEGKLLQKSLPGINKYSYDHLKMNLSLYIKTMFLVVNQVYY